MNPAIVISAFNRPHALARLLSALNRAEYTGDVPLIISIDRGTTGIDEQVARAATQFDWRFGPKRVICHAEHLGLVAHVYFCGGLAKEYGAVIFLEDDLGVSPVFYKYASQALAFYDADSRIAGISLYALWFNGYTQQPFIPFADGADVFFIQVPYTQGQAWTRAQWQRFTDWRASGKRTLQRNDNLHDAFLHFPADDWFPTMAKYVIETNQFYVYPRVSLTNGQGDAGTHFAHPTRFLQVPLLHAKDTFALKTLDDALAVYDSFFEIQPDRLNRLTAEFTGVDYCVDLYGTKQPRHMHTEYVFTARRSRMPIRTFGKTMFPPEMNIIERVPGNEINFCRVNDLRWDWRAEIETQKINRDYFTRRQRTSKKLSLAFAILDWIQNR